MQTYHVNLDNIKKAIAFSEAASRLNVNIQLTNQNRFINAKSVLGIFSLDLSKPIELQIDQDDLPKELLSFLV